MDVRELKLRYAGVCRACDKRLAAGTLASYDDASRQVACLDCVGQPPVPVSTAPVLAGEAGASAGREYVRRAANREARVRARHPRIGGFLLAVGDEPQHITAWQTGERGEVVLGRHLDGLAGRGVKVLHHRRIPRSRANIDHIAVGAAGVFVLDAKRYKGRPSLKVEGGILRPRVESLLVGRRNCSSLVAGMSKQLALVKAALDADPVLAGTPVAGMLVFVDADWPLFGGAFSIDEVKVLWPKRASKHILEPGPLPPHAIDALHRRLAAAFPAA
jgi:hypothetical protein